MGSYKEEQYKKEFEKFLITFGSKKNNKILEN
jgi:hypothetical protein